MRRWRKTAALVTLAGFLLGGCGGAGGEAAPGSGECPELKVVVTTSILGDVVGNLAEGSGTVEVLMPLGADPHSFQVSAGQGAALRRADLVVVNGLGLEEGMGGAIEAAAADGVAVIEAGSFVEALPFAAGPGEVEAAAGEGNGVHGTLDPHIWTDPVRMADVATGLGEALAAADPACPSRWREAAARYRQELLRLDEEIEAILGVIPAGQRKLVTNHGALGYFADRYGFEVLGTIIPGGDTLAGPSPADLAALVDTLEREGVRTIFSETTQSAGLAEAVAAELGQGVVVVGLFTGSLGGPGSGAETYLSMQRTNAERIADALGGS
ncbi:MAG TPA: metal ABC transporter substrate-binding protein [Acidimicrobiia bacterium]|nr:metal ABC transporter substrate-binding protein [Acidimicrobiia bacterium]